MAAVKISELTPASSVNATDLLETSQFIGGNYVSRSVTEQQITDFVESEILPDNGIIPNTYPSNGASIPQITVDERGVMQSIGTLAIIIAISQVTGLQTFLDQIFGILEDYGTAADKTATNNSLQFVSSVSGTVNNNRLVKFVDNIGTVGNADATVNNAIQIGNSNGNLSSLPLATNGQILIGSTGAQPVFAIPTNGTNISWTSGAGSLSANLSGIVNPALGGTGINNGVNTITLNGNLQLASNFSTSGNFTVTQTYTGPTNVTFPTSGLLATITPDVETITSNTTLNSTHNGKRLIVESKLPLTITCPNTVTENIPKFCCEIYNAGLGDVTLQGMANDVCEFQSQLIATNAQAEIYKDVAGTPNIWRSVGGTMIVPWHFSWAPKGSPTNGQINSINLNIDYYVTLFGAYFNCVSGSGTGQLTIEGVSVTGGSLAFSTSFSNAIFTNAFFAPRAYYLQISWSSISSLVDPSLTLYGTRRQ